MAYIYQIKNSVNNKVYVGKTVLSIEQRFLQHKRDSGKTRCENRPLYSAMNKHGKENFYISLLEECSAEEAPKREVFWVNELQAFTNGYNATLGGDSRSYYNYVEIAQKYVELGNQKETARFFQCDPLIVKIACNECKVPILTMSQVNKKAFSKKVLAKSLKGDAQIEFESQTAAAKWILETQIEIKSTIPTIVGHIGRVCRKERSSAYKYVWEYI